MTDMLSNAATFLRVQRRASMSGSVSYSRGASSLSGIPATTGSTVFAVEKGYGLVERVESRDYLIDVADLGALATPQAGDIITETLNGVAQCFEVLAPNNEPPFRYSDRTRKTLRIHTKYVGVST